MFAKSKMVFLAIAAAAVFAFVATADAATVKKKRHAKTQWKGYGFLPGYAPYEAARLRKKGYRGPIYGYRYGGSPFTYTNPPFHYYRYGGYGRAYYVGNYYYGAPGFYRGQYNGGSFGPCWTQTPIGPIWNCGR